MTERSRGRCQASGELQRALAETDSWLERMATRERRSRKLLLWATQFAAGT